MARTTIFPTQEVAVNTSLLGAFPAASITPAPFTLELGKTYAVQWGDALFENLSVVDTGDGIPGSVAIGNGSILEYPGNNEPFAIAYFSGDFPEIMILFLDGSESQTITVYLEDAGGGGGEEETTNPIVLKDRTGTDIEYEGVEGVRVFDRDGNAHVFVPPVETEEKTVELDFSGGAMEVTPTAGKLLSKVGIPVPENLLPENIAKDVDIAGVVGTHEGGGGDGTGIVRNLCIFNRTTHAQIAGYSGSITERTAKATIKLPYDSIVHDIRSYTWQGNYTSSTAVNVSLNTTLTMISGVQPTITKNDDGMTISLSSYKKSTGIIIVLAILSCDYTVPGIYVEMLENDIVGLYADETVTLLPQYMKVSNKAIEVNLAESNITTIPTYAFFRNNLAVINLPATVQTIEAYGLYTVDNASFIIDMTHHTNIPTLSATTAFNTNASFEIRVPAALYDEWKAAANWSTYANRIVPV